MEGFCSASCFLCYVAMSMTRMVVVLLSQVDCDDHKAVCSKFGIQGFPTIKWFPKGSLEPKE